jgi:hypothetical protein
MVLVTTPRRNYYFGWVFMTAMFMLLAVMIAWLVLNWQHSAPNIMLSGINSKYIEGDPIDIKLEWSNLDQLRHINLEIPQANIQKSWRVNTESGSKTARFVTSGWLPVQHNYTLNFSSQHEIIHSIDGSFFIEKRDIIPPTAQVMGIQAQYNAGAEITYTIQAADNRTLQKLTFSVNDSPIEQTWDVNVQQIAYQSSFSTRSWLADRYYDYVLDVIDDAGNRFELQGRFWLAKVDTKPPQAEISGIKTQYTIGELINYQFNASDDEKLRQVSFKVLPDRVSQIWHINTIDTQQQATFSTENWQAGDYEYKLEVIDHNHNIYILDGKFSLLQLPSDESFAGQIVGIEHNYQIGDTVKYKLLDYDQANIKTLLFEIQPDMQQITWHKEQINNIIEHNFSTADWNEGVYTYFVTAFGAEQNIIQRQQGVFTLLPAPQSIDYAILALLDTCQQHIAARRYTVGRGGNALECYRQVLAQQPNNQTAIAGIKTLEGEYHKLIRQALGRKNTQSAQINIDRLALVNPQAKEIAKFKRELQQLIANQAAADKADKARTTTPTRPPAPKPATTPPPPSPAPSPVPSCPTCNCADLLTKLSIGVEPLTKQEQAYQRAHCQ